MMRHTAYTITQEKKNVKCPKANRPSYFPYHNLQKEPPKISKHVGPRRDGRKYGEGLGHCSRVEKIDNLMATMGQIKLK
jgi:hypothetical protein